MGWPARIHEPPAAFRTRRRLYEALPSGTDRQIGYPFPALDMEGNHLAGGLGGSLQLSHGSHGCTVHTEDDVAALQPVIPGR
jgi:hypothetical protein